MNLLFLTLVDIKSFHEHGIYQDLMREFTKNGHSVFIVSPTQRRENKPTYLIHEDSGTILKVRIGTIQKTNLIEKGISTLFIERQFKAAIEKHYSNVTFDVVMYSTPPITFGSVIQYIKQRDRAKSYLLLKDIFPQNAVDLGMFSDKGLIYRYFRHKEKELYLLSDSIGCMSQANVDYLITHNPYLDKQSVHISPNSIEPQFVSLTMEQKREIRKKYNIPQNRTVFIYGGNLGKPQDIPFIIECLKANEGKDDRFFVICGTGTEYSKLQAYVQQRAPKHFLLLNMLPQEEYIKLVAACDIGLIFLDKRFTIPNFPSRLLSYMQSAMPVLACTDVNTDLGNVITDGGFGWWCEGKDANEFEKLVQFALSDDSNAKGNCAKEYLYKHFLSSIGYEIIINMLRDI